MNNSLILNTPPQERRLIYLHVVLTPPGRGEKVWLWCAPKCPVCEGQHFHGAGTKSADYARNNLMGGRAPHCPSPMYWKRFRRCKPTNPRIPTWQDAVGSVHFVLTEDAALNGMDWLREMV